MKTYEIPVTWSSVKNYQVEAENLNDAVKKALEVFFNDTTNADGYIEDSYGVDEIIQDNYPNEDYSIL